MTQLIGVVAYGVVAFASALGIFGALKVTMGIRVSEEEELEGLDLAEHGGHAYDLSGPTSFMESMTKSSSYTAKPSTSLANEQA
jgi:hypothetical protein